MIIFGPTKTDGFLLQEKEYEFIDLLWPTESLPPSNFSSIILYEYLVDDSILYLDTKRKFPLCLSQRTRNPNTKDLDLFVQRSCRIWHFDGQGGKDGPIRVVYTNFFSVCWMHARLKKSCPYLVAEGESLPAQIVRIRGFRKFFLLSCLRRASGARFGMMIITFDYRPPNGHKETHDCHARPWIPTTRWPCYLSDFRSQFFILFFFWIFSSRRSGRL